MDWQAVLKIISYSKAAISVMPILYIIDMWGKFLRAINESNLDHGVLDRFPQYYDFLYFQGLIIFTVIVFLYLTHKGIMNEIKSDVIHKRDRVTEEF